MGLFGNILKGIGTVGAAVAAPFTAGTSLSFLPAILGGVGAVGGALSNTKGARTSESTSTSTRTPILSENVQAYLDSLIGTANQNLSRPLNPEDLALNEDKLLGGLNQLDVTGRSRINALAENQRNNVTSSLAARGLASSPGAVSNAFATSEGFRGTNLANLSNNVANQRLDLIKAIEERRANLPILFENLLNDRLRAGGSFLSSIPLASSITTSGTNVGAGSAAAGALQGGLQGFGLGGGFDGLFNFGQNGGGGNNGGVDYTGG